MAGEITLLAATSAETAIGTGTFGAVVNKFAVEVNTSGTAVPTLIFSVSLDGVIFAPVVPAVERGSFLIFDTPAQNVQVRLDGNGSADTVSVSAVPYTD